MSGGQGVGLQDPRGSRGWPRKASQSILDSDSRSKGFKGYASGSLGDKGLAFTVPGGQGVGFQGVRGSRGRPTGSQGVKGTSMGSLCAIGLV